MDTETIEPMHGGAMVLVDDDLDAVSVRMYNEAKDSSQYLVKVESLRPGPLLDSVTEAAAAASSESATFSKATAASVDAHHQNFKRRLDPRCSNSRISFSDPTSPNFTNFYDPFHNHILPVVL